MMISTRDQRAGFALVVSLVLMSFILLLLLSIGAMVSVETKVSDQSKMRIEADQNALLALSVALGELQHVAGPDQRVTARADLQYPSATHSKWTGVYGHALTPDYDLDPVSIATEMMDTTKVDTQGSPAKLVSWLVSGNQVQLPTFGTAGEIIAPAAATGIDFSPDGSVANLMADTVAGTTQLTINDVDGVARAARILVGPGQVERVEDFVVAPAVEIEAEVASAAGGRYAWWVGDEGIKARGDLSMPQQLEEVKRAFNNAPRAAIELMDRAEALDLSGSGLTQADLVAVQVGDDYDPLAAFERAADLKGLGLLSSASDFPEVLNHRYHDISMHSMSVLSDSFVGGLKRDLSILLDESYSPAVSDPTSDSKRLWVAHPGDQSEYGIPSWRHLRSFVQTRVDPATNSVDVRLPAFDKSGEVDDVGVAPVLTYVSLGFRAAPDSVPADGVGINMNFYPMVVLWNPYDFTLKVPDAGLYPGSGNFEVGFLPASETTISLDVYDPGVVNDPTSPDDGVAYEWRSKDTFTFNYMLQGADADQEYIRFRLNCPDIPPGQSLIFCLPPSASGSLYTESNLPVLENIEPEPSSYVSLPFSQFEPGESDKEFRLANSYYFPWWNANGNWQDKGRSLTNGKSGLAFTYLGEPVQDRVNYNNDDPETTNPSAANRRWYQSHISIGWDNNVVTEMPGSSVLIESDKGDRVYAEPAQVSVMQSPEVLFYDPPSSALPAAYAMVMQALFSGEGWNAQLNNNQYMYTTRWVAQGNMRAVRSGRGRRDKNYNVLFTATTGTNGVSTPWQKFQSDEGSASNRTSAGSGHDWKNGAPVEATLFEFAHEDDVFQSIGQLQHANLSLIADYPSYPIGNSIADFRLNDKTVPASASPPGGYELARVDFDGNADADLRFSQEGYYDISYLLNRNLWDRYYFSTVPADGVVPNELPNSRYLKYGSAPDLQNPDESAAGLMLLGGFNINSTSEQAWRAVLAGVNQLAYDPETEAATGELSATFSRFLHPTANDDPNLAWEGYRTLTDAQIAQLAHNVVEEVRNRGPFISLSDFINRRLVDNPATDDGSANSGESCEHENYRGTLQAAIDRTDVNFPANDKTLTFWDDDALTDKTQNQPFYDKNRLWGGDEMKKPYTNRSAFAPKYVTQADVLSTIGASLSARSDTFTIRAYGEVVSPVTSDVVAQSWCEAVVQRLPDYVDSGDASEEAPTTSINREFGRKFKILRFRWLSNDEV
ncbi:hypothetical protein [Coraliomargarita parva]|uniref:hypothetical protein n=1 Tax=Coraliomargarita parva TaxID=3014050 RepID=UPI0022B4BD6C|nr:hypothetical protein [Coraliomargarita parva]